MHEEAAVRTSAPVSDDDRTWLTALWRQEWGGEIMVSKGQVYRLNDLEALIAWEGNTRVGAATYRIEEDECELMSINATVEGRGIGSELLKAVELVARTAGCKRVWLITSNDNIDAIRFYQRKGYRLVAIHSGAVDQARLLKPSIPLVGNYDIPIHDELELEKRL